MTTFIKMGGLAGLVFVAMGGPVGMSPEQGEKTGPNPARYSASADCQIKGNISTNSGEKIYYLPDQEYYRATEIRPYYGERWFCSEADAIDAGWRPARH